MGAHPSRIEVNPWGILTITGENLYVAVDEMDQATFSTSAVCRLSDDGSAWVPIQTKMQSAKERMYAVDQLAGSGETFYLIAQINQGAAALSVESRRGPVDKSRTEGFETGNVGCVRQNRLRQRRGWTTVPLG